jgi:hypothetical protein
LEVGLLAFLWDLFFLVFKDGNFIREMRSVRNAGLGLCFL